MLENLNLMFENSMFEIVCQLHMMFNFLIVHVFNKVTFPLKNELFVALACIK
jgi:hypothetical protein